MTHGRRGTATASSPAAGRAALNQPGAAALLDVARRRGRGPACPRRTRAPETAASRRSPPARAASWRSGRVGPVGHPTSSAVWTLARTASSWRRVPDAPALGEGRDGLGRGRRPGLRRGRLRTWTSKAALVWLSRDGTDWDLAPAQDSLAYHGLGITMADVVAGPGPARRGRPLPVRPAVRPGNGLDLRRRRAAPGRGCRTRRSFGQGEPQAVIAGRPGLRRDRDRRRPRQLHPDGLAEPVGPLRATTAFVAAGRCWQGGREDRSVGSPRTRRRSR